ncbi:hypothetical protein L1049_007929 [Liquidambar formosana]|uniref:Uncharacterized protein n=1 Tax=Liquidambar formosana TaxID=63359 RepID=A0AAP0S2U8_LIQFO
MERKQSLTLRQAHMMGNIISEADEGGGGSHNLDLKLGMAPPCFANGQKEHDNGGGFQFQRDPDDMPDDRRARIENSASATARIQPPHAIPMASEHPPIWNGLNSSFFPIYKERAIEKRMEVDSAPMWAWQIQGLYGGATPVPLFSTAASSGFSSSNTNASSAAVTQPQFPNTTVLSHHYSPSITNTNNICHYYCRS